MNKTIVTSVFESSRGNYEDLLRVFLYSAKRHMPEAEVKVVRDVPDRKGRSQAYNAMTSRLDSWVPVVNKILGDTILCDVDLVFRADLFEVFNKFDFDIAYTGRVSTRKPINGGVVFIRDGSQSFVEKWSQVNFNMFSDEKFHSKWQKFCCGMNQPAFWYLLKNPSLHGCRMLEIPCLQYNACEDEWPKMSDDVQVVHLKQALRVVAKGKGKVSTPRGAERAIAMWKEYDEESKKSA